MNEKNADTIRQSVRQSYAEIARRPQQGGGCDSNCGCKDSGSTEFGYSSAQLLSLPEGADLGLGCGNPQAIASLTPGETVLDLGSGAGIDCFLAARSVGPEGHVIGVDMTPDMISKARANCEQGGYRQVEFRLGEIEHLPVADGSVDVILSNCVINLSPDKQQVFHEAFRVLKAGGRLAISDIVASTALPDEIRDDLQLYSGCMAGASLIADLQSMMAKAGFDDIRITPKNKSKQFIKNWAPEHHIEDLVLSADITAIKPAHSPY